MASTQSGDRSPTWAERLAALRYVPPLIKLVWSTSRVFTATSMVLRLARAFTPVITLWIIRLVTDAVEQAIRTGKPNWLLIWQLVALEFVVVGLQDLIARGSILLESLLGDLFSNRISVRIMEHASTLDLAQFEDPTFYDLLERARRETVGRIGLLTQILSMAQDALTLATLVSALVVFNPWLVLLLAASIVPSFLGQTHFAALGCSLLFRWTPERRLLDYLRLLAASDRTAKEIQSFGLASWLTDRYRTLAHRFYEANRALSVRRAAVSAVLSLLGTLGYFAGYALVTIQAAKGKLTIGTFGFLNATFYQSRDLMQRLLLQAGDVYEQALYLRDLFLFFEIKPTMISRPGARPFPRPVRTGFVFEDVGFRYPGSERWAVRHINLTLRPGERVALVGENGAGKTTLTKLLARLYDPTEGRILLDGLDLRDYELESVRQNVAVIFQDFVRYDFPFDENIGVGQIEDTRAYLDQAEETMSAYENRRAGETIGGPTRDGRGSGPVGRRSGASRRHGANGSAVASATSSAPDGTGPTNPVPPYPPIARAAEQSLAASLLARLPLGYRQMLGRRFQGGVDLSGGEWQKIALARAYLRDAQVLILDEPTAALDARAEYEVFLRFSELVSGRMAVLISHRFSTVRMADRIIVLLAGPEGGHVVEEGTHDQLIERGGLYAELFQMQAAGYR